MNKWEKEVQKSLLDSEEAALKELEKQYAQALKEVSVKIRQFQTDINMIDQALSQAGLDDTTKTLLQSQKQSKIYQQQYQKALQQQISSILDKMHGDNYTTIDKYLHDCYESGYVGTMYDLAKQGMPIIAPIDQAAEIKAILTDSKVKGSLYEALGVDVSKLKKTIAQEISRGIATGMGYADIARNISLVSNAPLSRTKTIARTEGHRIQEASTFDAAGAAKQRGADLVKQWDASLDGRTRDSHRRVDGEIKELEEKFSNGLMYPGDPNGGAAEVVNCRCTMLTRARAALDESELEELKKRAAFFGLDKTENFKEFEEKYLKAAKTVERHGVGVSGSLHDYGDHLAPVLGSAMENSKEELQEIMSFVSDKGGRFVFSDDARKMVTNVVKGEPATIEIYKNASIGAVRHELRHFIDDLENGCPGIGYYLRDPELFFEFERRGYEEELEIARKLGYNNIVEEILAEVEQRRKEIFNEQ